MPNKHEANIKAAEILRSLADQVEDSDLLAEEMEYNQGYVDSEDSPQANYLVNICLEMKRIKRFGKE